MVSRKLCVVDASVGVKWFRNEPGSQRARALLEAHIDRRTLIVADSLFFYEVLSAASRDGSGAEALSIWSDLSAWRLASVPLEADLVSAALSARATLGCSLYDAFSAGLADLLDAPLYSADARAHGAHPRVELIV